MLDLFLVSRTNNVRGLSGKYRAYLYISALALFFIIGRVASFTVIPTWLNNTVPAMFPLLETVLELTFRDGLEYARRIIFNRRFIIESLSFEWCFEFWKQPKVTGCYVGTVQRLSKQCDTSDPRLRKIFSPTTFPCVSNTYKRGVSMYPRSIACLHARKSKIGWLPLLLRFLSASLRLLGSALLVRRKSRIAEDERL